jgi:hypothetical protein
MAAECLTEAAIGAGRPAIIGFRDDGARGRERMIAELFGAGIEQGATSTLDQERRQRIIAAARIDEAGLRQSGGRRQGPLRLGVVAPARGRFPRALPHHRARRQRRGRPGRLCGHPRGSVPASIWTAGGCVPDPILVLVCSCTARRKIPCAERIFISLRKSKGSDLRKPMRTVARPRRIIFSVLAVRTRLRRSSSPPTMLKGYWQFRRT